MIRTFSYSKFLNLDTVTLWFNPLWKNSPTYAKCIGEIERGGTCSDEVWNHMIARIHFLYGRRSRLSAPPPVPEEMLILRLFRVLLQVYELFCVAYVGCLWKVRQPTGPPPSKSEFALFQTSSLYVLPRSISPTHLANVGKFFQSGLNQRTVSKFRNLEYENFPIMFYTSFIKRSKTSQ